MVIRAVVKQRVVVVTVAPITAVVAVPAMMSVVSVMIIVVIMIIMIIMTAVSVGAARRIAEGAGSSTPVTVDDPRPEAVGIAPRLVGVAAPRPIGLRAEPRVRRGEPLPASRTDRLLVAHAAQGVAAVVLSLGASFLAVAVRWNLDQDRFLRALPRLVAILPQAKLAEHLVAAAAFGHGAITT
jgi:hypothetical protein